MPSPNDLQLLRLEVESDLEAVQELVGDLQGARTTLSVNASQQELSYIAYLLHGIYTGWEGAFHRIAVTFENQLDPARWHEQLVRRMALDLTPVRPAVIGTELLEDLATMRSFRHFFRHSYAVRLRLDKLELVLKSYDAVAPAVGHNVRRFLEAVHRIAGLSENGSS